MALKMNYLTTRATCMAKEGISFLVNKKRNVYCFSKFTKQKVKVLLPFLVKGGHQNGLTWAMAMRTGSPCQMSYSKMQCYFQCQLNIYSYQCQGAIMLCHLATLVIQKLSSWLQSWHTSPQKFSTDPHCPRDQIQVPISVFKTVQKKRNLKNGNALEDFIFLMNF